MGDDGIMTSLYGSSDDFWEMTSTFNPRRLTERSLEELCGRQVDGIVILVSLDLDMEFIRSARGEIPFIAIDVDPGSDLPAVLVDQEKGSLLAVRHVTGSKCLQ